MRWLERPRPRLARMTQSNRREHTVYLNLPKGAKPSKTLSADPTRPILQHAWLRPDPVAENVWQLITTDAYVLVMHRLMVKNISSPLPELTEGPIHLDHLRMIEQAKHMAWACDEDQIHVLSKDGMPTGIHLDRRLHWPPGSKPFDVDQLMSGWPAFDQPGNGDKFGLNGKYLANVQAAFGSECTGLVIRTATPLRPVRLDPMGPMDAWAVQMPIRVTV